MMRKPTRFFLTPFSAALILGLFMVLGRTISAETTTSTDKAEFVGAQTCLSCHADRDSFKNSSHAKNMARMKGIEYEKSCETCHGPGSLHAAAAGDKSNPGYATIKSFKNSSSADVNAACLTCHQDQGRLHWAGGTHEKRGVTCLNCHSVHNPKNEKKLLTSVDEKSVCFQCHQDIKAEIRRNSHMPILEGKMSCSDCHNPHGSATDKMLVADNVNQLCFKCHAEKRGPFLWTHSPVQENCLTCHVPHGSHNDKMLVAKLPMLCQRCHFNGGHNNAAYDAVNISRQENRSANKSCANCHSNIHGSNHPSGKFFVR